MKPAQNFAVLALVFAAGWVVLPREAVDMMTGSIELATLPEGEAISCDQLLYLEEVELLSGAACG